MKRRRAVRYVLVIAVIVVIALLIVVRARPGAQRLSDAQVVFCLSTGERVQLAGAAVSLGLAKPASSKAVLVDKGRDLTVEEWRQTFPSAFDRACSALTDSAQIPADGSADPGVIVSLLINLAGVLAGGLIGWMSSEFRAAAERNRAQAEALAAAAREFDREASDYLSAWADRSGAKPSDVALRARRADLVAQLGLVQSIHPRWTGISPLKEMVLRGELGEGLAEALLEFQQDVADGSAACGWPEKVCQLKQSLHAIGVDVTVVTGTLLRASAWRRADPASPRLKSGAARPDLASLPVGGGQ